jgi:hypothetical protein
VLALGPEEEADLSRPDRDGVWMPYFCLRSEEKKNINTRASLDRVATSLHLVKIEIRKGQEERRMNEKYDVFPRPGGDYVAPGKTALGSPLHSKLVICACFRTM